MPTAPLIRTLAVAAALAPTALPGAAQADSISFLRGGNLWVASTDGAQQVQLTTTGGYSYQSRADDGSFIALKGRQLHRLTATGQLVAEFNTPVSFESPAGTSYFRGPFKPEISPDGSKVAYEYYHQTIGIPGCTPTWECNRLSVGIGYSYPDRNTSWDEPGLGRQSGWTDPSWIDNGTLLMSDKSVRPNADAILDRPGDGNNKIEDWFEENDAAWYLRDAEISRRGDAAAFVTTKPRAQGDPKLYQQDDQVTIFRMTGPAPAPVQPCFSFRNDERVLASPSFAPDGHAIAFESHARHVTDTSAPVIEVGQLPSQAAACTSPAEGSVDLLVDATNPDWSPAGVPTLPTNPDTGKGGGTPDTGKGGGTPDTGEGGTTPDSGKPDSGKGGGDVPGTQVVTKGGLTLTVAPGPVARTVKRGLRPQIVVPGAGRVELKATYKGRTVAAGKATAKQAGTLTPKLKFTSAGKRALKRAKHAAVTVRFTFRPKGGKAVRGSAKVTLRG